MSSETLSQNEIDALLDSAGGNAAAIAQTTRSDAQIYDFRRPHRISKEKLRALEAMYERLTKALEGWLIGRVRGNVHLTLQSVEHFSFGEFILSLPTPCASYTFEIAEAGAQQGVIDFGSEFSYFLVDRLFGGSGDLSIMTRAMTPIERMAVRLVAERVMNLLVEVWQDHVALKCEINGFESIPEILRAANPEDSVLVANIQVEAGGAKSFLLLCLPFAVLEHFFTGATDRRPTFAGTSHEQAASRELTEVSLRATRVSVSARLPEFRLSIRELRSLSVGSVLATGVPRTAPLSVSVGTQARFQAAPGRIGSSLAVRLLDRIGPAPDESTTPTTRS